MKRPSFLAGVAVALSTATLGAVLHTALSSFYSPAGSLRLLIAAIGFAYIIYLLVSSREPVGRITTVVCWLLIAGSTWFLQPSLALYLSLHLGVVWLVRSLYFYSSLLSGLADLALTALGLAAGVWAATQTGSLFLSLWCFFLVQALFVVIPVDMSRKAPTGVFERAREDRFHYAHRVAESALRRLTSIP